MVDALSTKPSPLMIASIFVETDGFRNYWRLGETWNDQGEVAGPSYHGIQTVCLTLPCTFLMNVDVCDNRTVFGPAQIPQQAEAVSTKDNYAGRISRGVEVVVVDNMIDLTTIIG
ncbi:MAG: hypothetical protein ACREQR_06810 [Candidatus Binataceae bacterium]